MGKRIVTAVKQRFSIRKLSIGAASVLLGTSLYFMGGASATIVHADTETSKADVPVKPASAGVDGSSGQQKAPTNDNHKIDKNELDSIARNNDNNDTAVNDAIDKYAQVKQEEVGNNALIRASGKEPTPPANTADTRRNQVDSIAQKLDQDVYDANQEAQKISDYKNAHPNTVSGRGAKYFADQGLSVDDEKGSEINQITVDHNNDTLPKGQSETIDGIYITHTDNMTNKEQYVMKINSNNKVIVDFQHDQCQGKEITVTYDKLKNSYYLENIDNKTNKIKISKIERTFSDIQEADKTRFTSDGHTPKGADGAYDKCYGPQLIIYNDPSDGFFYNNITQISVKDIYYDDKGQQIDFNDNNKAWIFVTSLNSNGWGNIEKVRALGSDNSPVNGEKIAGSTVTDHNDGWWYSDNNNNFNNNPNWDNRDEDNRFGFVGTVAFQYHPGMTLQYSVEDWQWGSHWACTQTQVVSSLYQPVIIYDHIKDKTESVTRNDTVTRTIHYLYDDGNTAKPDKTQTVSFNETGTKDDVTGKTTWDNDNAQSVDSVTTPSITGYTPDKPSIEEQAFKFGDKDVEVTVRYNANTQTARITYIDDTTKTNLESKETSGKFGQAITFETAPADEIENYKKQGNVLVSSTFDNNKYQADNSNNVFYVHFVHDTKNVSRNSNVKMTVHYVMDDNSEAPSDNKQTVNFTENGIQDLVTKHIDWTPAVSQTFKDVATPKMTVYTPDQDNVTGQAVNFGDNDVNVTVHYSANTQTATITYIDDTEKKTLSSDNQNGKFNQVIAFEHDPAEVIKGFEEKGYVFVSNTFDNQKYQADNSNNVFEVHFVHGTKNVSRKDDVNMTVHYVMDDNSEAPSDNKQTLSFTENGIQDLVTKHIDWTTANSQTFKDVVTPKVAGYTPDQDKVTGPTVNFGDNDVEVTVTYSPNVQLGHINYIDDDTKKTLTRDNFSGRTNEHEDYTSTDRIQEFENKGYELVSNDYPDGGFNFDNNDRQDQVFNVHFKHGTVTVTTKNPQTPNTPINPDPQSPKYPKDISNTNSDVKRTIDYEFKDGKTAQPTVKDSLHFERTVVIDKVTGKVLSDTWTPSQNFSDIQTPAIQGYTPDRTAVSDKNIGHDHQDIIEHVVYSPDTQHMTITYIDDTTGKTLHTDNPTGVSDQDAKYTTSDTIKKYEDQHYKLVSDSTKGQDLIFDHDDDADQTYEVHFVHGKHAIDQTTSPKQTIHYVYADGLARQGKAADDNVQQLSFKRDGYNDEVTGVDHWNAWTPANSQYEAVDSPVIQGYTPDELVVEKSTVNPTDKDIEITVTYNADKQAAKITYIDDTTGKTLTHDDFSGRTNEHEDYTPIDRIQEFENKGYELVSNDYPDGGFNFDDNDQQDQVFNVHLKHGTTTVTPENPGKPGEPVDPDNPDGPKYPAGTEEFQVKRTGTQTIHYVGAGDKTPADNKQTFVFTREITFDNVTGKIISVTPWNIDSHTFGTVKTPVIPGYHADKAVAGGATVIPDDLDKVITVTYIPDGNPGNPGDQGDTPTLEPTPEPEPTPDDQPDSEISSDDNFEKAEAKDKLNKTNPKKVDAYKKQRKIIKTKIAKQSHTEIIKTKIAKQGHTEIAEPIEDKVTRENNVKVVSDPVENKAAEPKLPQTGEADNSIIGLLGMLLASFAAMFGFDSLHSHDKKHKN